MRFDDLNEDGKIVKGVNTTTDVGTDQTSIEAKKLGFKVNKDGYPPELHSKAKKNSKPNTLYNLGLAEQFLEDIQTPTPAMTQLERACLEGGHAIPENISYTGTATAKRAKKKGLKPGDPEWFKNWFDLPYFMKEDTQKYLSENPLLVPALAFLASKGYKVGKTVYNIIKNAPPGSINADNLIQLAVGSGAAAKLAYDKMTGKHNKKKPTTEEADDVIARAEQFAQKAHADHKRKYTGLPYYTHLDEVRNIVKSAGGTANMQAAALLHDTIEDTATTEQDILDEFGPAIAKLVVELTDVSKPEDGNRATRKAIDRDKLAGVSADAQTIKYADLISNGKDIAKNDPKFARVYHKEKADLLRVMTKGNKRLYQQAYDLLPDELKEWVCGKCYAEPCKCGQNETKEAPPGTYFTKSGNLVKGKLTKDAKARGARQTDPKDDQRSKVPAVTQYNEEKMNIHSVLNKDLQQLDSVFDKAGFEIRIVGGAVRDIALGKTPKDIDLATDATPNEMERLFDSAGIKHKPTGIEYGTISAIMNGVPYEITTLRADVETDGRRADVKFVRSWQEDAKRRDLTYNAMSMDFDGNLYDYYGGMDDLQDRVSRFVGDPAERIKEDYLRILRYFRFQGKLDSPRFSKQTIGAIKDNVQGLSKVSAERVWQEMGKLLSGQNIAQILSFMDRADVSKQINLPTANAKSVVDNQDALINLARLVDDSSLAKRWKMSNDETATLDFLVKNKNKKLNRAMVQNFIADGVDRNMLARLAKLQGSNDLDLLIKRFDPGKFPVTGDDLIAKGMKPGPELGKTLADLRNKWKQSDFKATKKDLLGESTDMPTISLKDLYHVGTMDASKKGDFSYEGNGLSVSTEPDAWRRIARGQVAGDTYTATKQGNSFLDSHKLTPQHNEQIKQWAIQNGFLEQQETVTVSWYDDEMDDTLSQTFNSMADAEAEHGEYIDDYDVDVDKGGIVPTDKLKKATGQRRIEATGVLEYVLPLYAESLGLDGVWWADELDVSKLSAPRGVIVPGKIDTWKFKKEGVDENEKTKFVPNEQYSRRKSQALHR